MDKVKIFKVLANEKRFQILNWLKEPGKHFTSQHCDPDQSGVCVGLIEKKAGLSQSTISHYLSLMEQAGLITMERSGQWTFCKLNKPVLKAFLNEMKDTFL